jgi:2-polyprenyl-3-methyl-5-hydroxy-6-metoxy-1,4-benzoquinol methylase
MADQGNEGLLSSFLRRQRVKAAAPLLKGQVLDFGCGSGELAKVCPPERYVGFDSDQESIALARRRFPLHHFSERLPERERFDTIAALAVIEHVLEPSATTSQWCSMLAAGGQIVVTTPYPSFGWIHELGARIGLFSAHAAEEHQELINFSGMKTIAASGGLTILTYRRFLFGANQLFVLTPA